MVKVFLILSLLMVFLPMAKAQNQENKLLIEEYLRRSEQQKKTGLILLGAGAGSVILGTVLFSSAWSNGGDGVGGALLMTAGSISMLVSFPVLVSSASNGRKAAKVGIGTARVPGPQPNRFSGITYPALSIFLPLNSQKP